MLGDSCGFFLWVLFCKQYNTCKCKCAFFLVACFFCAHNYARGTSQTIVIFLLMSFMIYNFAHNWASKKNLWFQLIPFTPLIVFVRRVSGLSRDTGMCSPRWPAILKSPKVQSFTMCFSLRVYLVVMLSTFYNLDTINVISTPVWENGPHLEGLIA